MAETHMMIAQYIRDTVGQPFVWGHSDCVMWATGAVLAATHSDPMSGLRGRYDSEQDAHAMLRAEGGMVPMFDGRMNRSVEGVCVVRLLGKLTAGLFVGGRVACKSETGIVFPRIQPMGVWF